MGYMPDRSPGLEGVPLDETNTLVVGKIPVRGAGLRVGMQCGGQVLLMSPAKARRVAAGFDNDLARDNDLDWVSTALREAADEIEATPHAEQMLIVDQAWATIAANGARQ